MGNDDIPGVVKTQAQLKTIWRIMIKVNKIQTKGPSRGVLLYFDFTNSIICQ